GPVCHFHPWALATATEVTIPLVGPRPAMDWCRDQTGTAPGIRISAGGSDAGTIYFFAGGVRLAAGGGAVMPFAAAITPPPPDLVATTFNYQVSEYVSTNPMDRPNGPIPINAHRSIYRSL